MARGGAREVPALSSTSAPPPGTLLAGKYRVEGVLGTGGMGVVVAAHHEQLDQKVAIKLLLPEAAAHPEIVERFAREARAAAKIRGDHVARVIDVGALEDGSPYMVMEYLEGRDLAQELRESRPLATADVAHWILEACEAIAQAHAARIVHRDLKPSNLFLARQPNQSVIVKVLDFGISKSIEPNAPALTKTTSLVGTAYYMSSEQLTAAKSVDTRADIWALGVIMYELLAGTPPFDGESMAEVIALILQNEPRPLGAWRPDLPAGFVDVVAKCMRSKPADRFQDLAELAAALAPFGTKADHASAESIARVLGHEGARVTGSAPPEAVIVRGSHVPSPMAQTLAQSAGDSSAGPPASSARPQPHLDETAAATPGVAASIVASTPSTAAPAQRSPLPLFAGLALGVLVVGGGGYAILRSKASGGTPPLEAAALVATAAPSAPSAEPTPTTTATTTSATTTTATTTTATTTAIASAAPGAASASGVARPVAPIRPGQRPPPGSTPAAASVPAAATTASAPAKGLQMDIK